MPAAITLPTAMILVMCLFTAIGIASVVYWGTVLALKIYDRYVCTEPRVVELSGALHSDSGELLGYVNGRLRKEP